MKPKISPTPQQQAVIDHKDGPLLVSAAAGSGKTRVLVERLLKKIETGDSIDQFLIITYTRAAAAELRERIVEEISSRLQKSPRDKNLRRQSMLVYVAKIDTIHAFCTDILRENAHHAKLPPDFRVADDTECEMLKSEILENVLNKAYETIETSPGFKSLVDTVSAGRDDKRLALMIPEIHAKLKAIPSPRQWIEKQIQMFNLEDINDAAQTVWGRFLMEKAKKNVSNWLEKMKNLRVSAESHPVFLKAYGPSIDITIESLEKFNTSLTGSWDQAWKNSVVEFPRAGSLTGFDELKELRNRCKDDMKKCAEIFECSSEDHLDDILQSSMEITALFKIISDFDLEFAAEKLRRGIVDFSDLEHLVLDLLIDEKTGEKSPLARSVSKRFKEIMVDEYQDVNAVQELIFNAVSQNGQNIFMVGDVKQSIYRFRLADPTIFLGKYKKFMEDDCGTLINLSSNFRSSAGVLNAVNTVFSEIMSEEFGEMDYTEREYLIPGRADITCETICPTENIPHHEPAPAAEICVIDMSDAGSDDDENPAKEQVEAGYIAARISNLIDSGYEIPTGQGTFRRAEYGDIVILLRSVHEKAWQYARALRDEGIPFEVQGGDNFFETLEVSAALSILNVIDNPMQDIPLAAALRGPVYQMSADELAQIRAGSKDTDFYTAVVKASENCEKCAAFLEDISALRLVAPEMPADKFIRYMYDKTGFLGKVGALVGGAGRRENLLNLAAHAGRFEQSGFKGLFGFLTIIKGFMEKGKSLTSETAKSDKNAVQIISVHRSKGLEFPIVFFANASKEFNFMDIRKHFVMHPELGIGTSKTDNIRKIEYQTLAKTAIQKKLTDEMKSEEMRVLYVAMTRAREKLIITAVFKDAKKEIEKLDTLGREGITPQILDKAKSMASWLLLTSFGRQNHNIINAETITIASKQKPDSIASDKPENHQPISKPDETSGCEIPDIGKRLSFVYPHKNASELPSKITVSGLKGRYAENDIEAMPADYTKNPEKSKRSFTMDRPGFVAETKELTAAERGTALHMAMQYIDYEKCESIDTISGQLEHLQKSNILTPKQAEAVDTQKILNFFQSDVGKRIKAANELKREFRFSLLYPAKDFFSGGGDDKILLQGVIDCFFKENGECVVIDFKTDYVTMASLKDKADFYKPQLKAYSEAIERICKKPVKERIIYFFGIDSSVSV